MSQTENSGQTSGRRFTSKHLIVTALVALAIGAGTAYAFSALTSTSTITVTEPLKITSPTISGGSCTVASDGITATCAATLNAGNTGTFTGTVTNAANTAISVAPRATSNSTDLIWGSTSTTQFSVPAGGSTPFTISFSISASAPSGEHILATVTFNR